MPLFDGHLHAGSHIFDAEKNVRDGELYLAVNSTSKEDAKEVLQLKKRIGKGIFAFVGLHPNSNQNEIDEIIQMIENNADIIDGIGEIGLDERNEDNKRNFDVQLEIAEKMGKPVNLHSRGKIESVIESLASYKLTGVLLHWFSGSDNELTKACDKGYFIGFGPASVYSRKLQRLIVKCPLDNIMTETDAPVKYSGCFEGVENDPRVVASVSFSVAMHKKLDAEEMEKVIERNFGRYIGQRIR
jgi:TatD DNase family protein